jgi:hypothetical protein
LGGWTVSKVSQPQLILMGVANNDPEVAELLADGTYCDSGSAVIYDSVINRMVHQTNICDTLEVC